MRSLSSTGLSFLFLLICTNSFATAITKKSSLRTFWAYRTVGWSSKDLTISIHQLAYSGPRYKIKVRSEEEFNEIIENGFLFGKFVVDYSLKDSENGIYGVLDSYTLTEADSSTKVVIAKIDTIEGSARKVVTTVNTVTKEISVFVTNNTGYYYFYDSGLFKGAPTMEVGDYFTHLDRKSYSLGNDHHVNFVSGLFLIRKGESVPMGVSVDELNEAANGTLSTMREDQVFKEIMKIKKSEEKKERKKFSNTCQIFGEDGEIKEVQNWSFVIVSSETFVNSPSARRSDEFYAKYLSENFRVTILRCYGQNIMRSPKSKFYNDLITKVIEAYKLTASVKPEVAAAKEAFLNLELDFGRYVDGESGPSLEARRAYLASDALQGYREAAFGSKSDFEAILELHKLVQD